MANLVIMESPAKAATVKSYLGSNYKVIATVGHIRDLPKSTLGVDLEDNFKAKYINIRGKGDLIKELKREAKAADRIYLATDPDREGEAISWHVATALGIPINETRRVTFNEVTKSVVKESIKHPRTINMQLVDAQQTRRILDRIVGYKLSPYLWKTVKSGLSAGRVQSAATRAIVDREREIRNFVPREYWTIDASLTTERGGKFTARFSGTADGGKIELESGEQCSKIIDELKNAEFRVTELKHTVKTRAPAPPFTTSTMQQEASRKLGFHSARTMSTAQALYEGVNVGHEHGGVQGLITYMRTDSLRVSSEFQRAALDYIKERFGEKYVPETPRVYKTKATAQDAHEAIRPTNTALEPSKIRKYLTSDQYKLYKLIWDRFMASQMVSAEFNTVSATISAGKYVFRANGSTLKFAGFLALYEESTDDAKNGNSSDPVTLPELKENEKLTCEELLPAQHFTEPPPRFTEASLIKFFEETGIGRPSTYTPIITTIVSRGYVKREGKSFVPTPLGEIITDLMVKSFPDIVDYKFTAYMETRLDEIENGQVSMQQVLSEFYEGFKNELDAALAAANGMKVEVPAEETDIICEKCGARMVVKNGRYGKFAACPNYPECKNTKPLNGTSAKSEGTEEAASAALTEPQYADFKCEKCGGDMVLRTGRYGSFYACVNYPKCKFTKQKNQVIGVKCPKCGGDVVVKYGKNKSVFYGCSNYPECDFSSWDQPTEEKCPNCGEVLYRKKGKNLLICHNEACGYKREIEEDDSAGDNNISGNSSGA
ncbi:MAG: type I DNA topoisomerase [Clostridiales bacterium]|nr:type I DNA topoisomerase [Clostridiales bacterium]